MPFYYRKLFTQNASSFITMALLLVVPVLGSSVVVGLIYKYPGLLAQASVGVVVLFFAITAVTMAAALTPTTFIAILSGFYFGWAGFPGMLISYGIALLLARAVANLLDHGKLWAFLHRFDKVARVLHELDQQQFGLIVMTRLSPVLPFALMNFVLALLQVRRRDYLLGSLLGMLPRTTFFYLLGTQGQRIIDLVTGAHKTYGSQMVLIGLTIVSVLGMVYYIGRAIRKALKNQNTDIVQKNF